MFSKILIANRGEIACRIIRTCQKLGIKTVAIYSEPDATGLHVKQADEAYCVGPAAAQDSYLNVDNILEAARTSGAEAIHPGYGFLSENAEFARRCHESGIKFIGPTPEVMEKMGCKLKARKLARKAGLPILPGTDEAVENHRALDRAWALGFPLMVKSAEGGGGIGIHNVNSIEDLMPLVDRTRQVATKAFGSPRLFFERYLKDASHIEVQLMGDEHGNLVHLFERDCSIQRRNQKLIEEAPASKLSPKLRQKICKLALKLGRHIGYSNAGTVEFLVSAQEQVYFLEMNTRLQVEHGVTELVTGVDLVELQLRVAAGEKLPLGQQDIQAHGHAVQTRVYPEDPETFMPDAGIISELNLPAGEKIRLDSALCKGYEVALHYEPLLAKVMTWGDTRGEALQRQLKALLAFRLEGVKYNTPLLRSILSSKEFTQAVHHTGSLGAILTGQKQCQHRSGKQSSMNGNGQEKGNREIAAAIGAALALSMHGSGHGSGLRGGVVEEPTSTPWRAFGRREQLFSRTLGSRSWR
ncbi:MAG: acetyl/propionyl/methylcrotonyl-CoA carboxylase subunit alpha [Dehalococcoidia bacterium]